MQANARIVTEEERMEMDDDVLTMFIQEEEKFDSIQPRLPKPPQVVKMNSLALKPNVSIMYSNFKCHNLILWTVGDK